MKKHSSIENIKWAFKKLRMLSPKIIFGIIISSMIYDGMWFFSSAIFIKKIVYSLSLSENLVSLFYYIGLVGIVFLILDILVNYNKNVILPIEKNKIYKGVYRELYQKSLKVDLSCFDNHDFYSKYTMAVDGADLKIIATVEHVVSLFTGFIVAVLIVIEIIKIDFFLILFLTFPLFSSLVIEMKLNKKRYERYVVGVHADKMFNYVNRVMYLPQYAKEMRTTNVFNVIERQFDDATIEKGEINAKYAKKIIPLEMTKGIFTFVCVFEGVLLYAMYNYLILGGISLAELTVLTSIMSSAVWMILGVFSNIGKLNQDEIFLENIKYFLNYEPKIDEDQNGIIPESTINCIEFDHVSFGFDNDNMILKDISFRINGGDVISIVGENGAGKSTLIKLLLRFYDPTSGIIKLNGIDIKKYNLKKYRKMFSASFQESSVLGISYEQNLFMGERVDDISLKKATEKAGLSEKINNLKLGPKSVLSKEFDVDGIDLSGGEKQKVCLARVFSQDVLIKIYDEPTSALDPVAEYEMFKNILEERKQKTIIMISHRLSSTQTADCVLFLENGEIVEKGTHMELKQQNGKYWSMYKKQAKEYLIEVGE